MTYSHYLVRYVPVKSTVDITRPTNAPQAPRERRLDVGGRSLSRNVDRDLWWRSPPAAEKTETGQSR